MHKYEGDKDNNLVGKGASLGVVSRTVFAWQNCHLFLYCMLILGEGTLERLMEVYGVKAISW